jgi:hypothetical protein
MKLPPLSFLHPSVTYCALGRSVKYQHPILEHLSTRMYIKSNIILSKLRYESRRRLPTYQRNALPPSSGKKSKPSYHASRVFTLLSVCMAYSSTSKIEALNYFEMSVNFFETVRHNIHKISFISHRWRTQMSQPICNLVKYQDSHPRKADYFICLYISVDMWHCN